MRDELTTQTPKNRPRSLRLASLPFLLPCLLTSSSARFVSPLLNRLFASLFPCFDGKNRICMDVRYGRPTASPHVALGQPTKRSGSPTASQHSLAQSAVEGPHAHNGTPFTSYESRNTGHASPDIRYRD